MRNLYNSIIISLLTTRAYGERLDDVYIGTGKSQLDDLSLITNIIKTGQSLLLYAIGPLLGTGMVIKGLKMIGNSDRGEKGPGVLMIVCGASCFLVGPIIQQFMEASK